MSEREKRHLRTKIRIFEDMLLRSRNTQEIEALNQEIRSMRLHLFRMGGGLSIASSFSKRAVYMKNQMVNMAWNMAEFMNSRKTPTDILWLYTGWINDSMMFNIVEYVFHRAGLIKD